MATALQNLKAALIVRANALTDELDQLECLALIDEWYNCRAAIAALTATNVVSYSINGQTVTRREIPSMQAREAHLYQEIKAMLFGGNVSHADLRFPIELGTIK